MAKQIKKDADWKTIDTATLATPIADAFNAYKDSYKDMKASREEFESLVAKSLGLPDGKRVIFGYNYGKLSMAIVDDDKPAAKSPKGAVSLSALAMR